MDVSETCDSEDIRHWTRARSLSFILESLVSGGWSNLQPVPFMGKPEDLSLCYYVASKNGLHYHIGLHLDSKNWVDEPTYQRFVDSLGAANQRQGVLVTTAHFSHTVERLASDGTTVLLDRDALVGLRSGKYTSTKSLKPRRYQTSVVEDVVAKLRTGQDRFLLEMATGLGKTVTSASLCKALFSELHLTSPRVLFLAHQIELLQQAKSTYQKFFRSRYSYGVYDSGTGPRDKNFTFITLQTAYSRLCNVPADHFDIVIVDEAHHTAARTFEEVVERFSPKVRLGLTATPHRTDGKEVIAEYFGGASGHVGRYTIEWAIRNRKLAFPIYSVMVDDLDENMLSAVRDGAVRGDIDKKVFLHKRDETIVKEIESEISAAEIEHPKVVVYCRSIAHMKHFIRFLPAGSALAVHSRMPRAERLASISAFRDGGCRFLLVVDLFNEGIDIPDINVIVFLRSTRSPVVWHQQLGRGLRRAGDKKSVLVLDFVGSLNALHATTRFLDGLQTAPSKPPEEPEEAEEPIHDRCIEVHYSSNAPNILSLLKTHNVDTVDKSQAIEALRTYLRQNKCLPRFEDLNHSFPGISASQIACLFKSYLGYLRAARVLTPEVLAEMANRYDRLYVEHSARAGISIQHKSLYLHVPTVEECPELTLAELRRLVPPLEDSVFTKNRPSAAAEPELSSSENSPAPAEPVPNAPVPADPIAELYLGVILTIADLTRLAPDVRQEIKKRYASELSFLQHSRRVLKLREIHHE